MSRDSIQLEFIYGESYISFAASPTFTNIGIFPLHARWHVDTLVLAHWVRGGAL